MNPAPSLLETADADRTPPPLLPEAQWEIIRFCVQGVKLLGVRRSIGEIFGYVFTSPQPVSFDEIVSGLGISSGSASHGLRYLRRVGALRITYMARDRRDHYQAETSFRRLFSNYLVENVGLHVHDQRARLSLLRERCVAEADERCGHLPERLDTLMDWLAQTSNALAAVAQSLQTPTQAPNLPTSR